MKALRSALLPLLGGVLALGGAGASPATDLYRAATVAVGDGYYGWSNKNFSLLVGEYASRLSERCAPQGDACDYATGRSVLGDLFTDFGDAHTSVRDPEAAERLRESTQNLAVQRTGIKTVRVEGGLLVTSVMPGSPAAQVGVRRFDLLTRVAGQEAGKRGDQNLPIGPNEFIRLERAAQPFDVVVRRAGQPDWVTMLQTALLQARDEPTLTWTGKDGKTAVIDYPSFLSSDSAALFLKRVQEAQAAGAGQLVVDLRYNSGGSLLQCVAAASVFGPVVYDTEYRVGGYTYTALDGLQSNYLTTLTAPASEKIWNGPAAVLVGPNTASCAEVFSFYAQKAGVKVIGEGTRGVGNSGVVFQPLPDGGVVGVTVLRAFTRDGAPLPASVTPDVLAPTDIALLTGQGQDVSLKTALTVLDDLAPAMASK